MGQADPTFPKELERGDVQSTFITLCFLLVCSKERCNTKLLTKVSSHIANNLAVSPLSRRREKCLVGAFVKFILAYILQIQCF